MTAEPLVSVILPTYNRAGLVGRAIRSVLTQGYRNLELIVVDDGSTDDTERVVREVTDGRVTYLRRANGGPAGARNLGLQSARGALVAFQDSDDEWLDGKLEQQVGALASAPAADLCVCSYIVDRLDLGSACRLGAEQLVEPGNLKRQTLEVFYFPTPAWLVRRSALDRAGWFDAALSCWEDWELALRLADGGEFVLVDRPLLLQHSSGRGVNSEPVARMNSLRRMLEHHGARWHGHPATLAEHRYTVGRLEVDHGTTAEARRQLHLAVTANPQHWKAWVSLGLTYAGQRPMRHLMELRRRLRGGPLSDRHPAIGPRDLG